MIQGQQVIEELGDRRKDPAYRIGWEDCRFGLIKTFLENPNLARWESHSERLAYYRGHREGRRAAGRGAEGLCLIPDYASHLQGACRASPHGSPVSLRDTSADAGLAGGRHFRALGRCPFTIHPTA